MYRWTGSPGPLLLQEISYQHHPHYFQEIQNILLGYFFFSLCYFGQSFINFFTVLLRYVCVLGISAFFALCSVFCCSLFCFLFFYIQFFSVLMFYFLCNYSKFFCFLCIVHFLCSIELSYCSPIFYSMLCVLLCYGTLFYILLFYMILLYSSLFYIM